MKFKKVLITVLILFIMITISSVSAADTSQNVDEVDGDVISLDINNENILAAENNNEISSNENILAAENNNNEILGDGNSNPGTFTDLFNLLSGKSEVTLDRDYTYNKATDKQLINGLQQGIKLTGSIVIHGNGHTLDANHKMGILYLSDGSYIQRLVLDNITFIDGESRMGGAVYFKGGELEVRNCIFLNNKAFTQSGGAIYVDSAGYTKIVNSTFKYNTATSTTAIERIGRGGLGGSIFIKGNKIIDITDCNFIDNKASHYGGAIHIHNKNKDAINIVNCNFTHNTAGEKGGAINIFNENPNSNSIVKYVIFGSKFNKNHAKLGGAIYYNDGPVEIIQSEFIENSASKEAGAIFRNGELILKEVLFLNNTPQNFDYTGGADDYDYDEPTSNPNYQEYNTNYGSIDKITVHNNQIPIKDNKLTLDVLNHIFNKDFRNGHLLVYIDGKLVFNATTTDNLLQIIFDLFSLLSGNHEIKVVFTDNNGNTNTYTENITI